MKYLKFFNSIRAFPGAEGGNFAIVAALLVPLAIAAGSFSVDIVSVLSMKIRLQNAADGAALATSSQLAQEKISEADAEAYAKNFFQGLVAEDSSYFANFSADATPTITQLSGSQVHVWQVKVEAIGSHELTPMGRFLGQTKVDVDVVGISRSSSEAAAPFSMALVLDKSGSMNESANGNGKIPGYCKHPSFKSHPKCQDPTKIEALKDAVASLVGKLEVLDPKELYVRLGAVAYNDKVAEEDKKKVSWHKNTVTEFTNSLVADGHTDSSDAAQWAFEELDSPTEINEHKSRNKHDSPQKFMLLMTDGDNNRARADAETRATCDAAKKKGIEIFSVAFQAPNRGKKLLKYCASGDSYYFDAQNASDLINAFETIGENSAALAVQLTQ